MRKKNFDRPSNLIRDTRTLTNGAAASEPAGKSRNCGAREDEGSRYGSAFSRDVGRMFYFSRDYGRAVAHYQAALEMDSNFLFAPLWLAQAYEQKRIFDAAIAALQAAVRISPDSTYALLAGRFYGPVPPVWQSAQLT